MSTADTEVFDQVMSALNSHKAKWDGEIPKMKQLLEQAGVTHSDWYKALSACRENSPTMAEIFFKAMGKDGIPPKQTRSPRKPKDEEPEEEYGLPDAEEPEDWTPAEVFTGVVDLLSKIGDDKESQQRILLAVAVFHGIKF